MQASDFFENLDFDPGKLLDHRYQIVAVLGRGGMGRVFKAFHVLLDAPVALKKLVVPDHVNPQQHERAIQRFCREARLLTRLRHPNIPRVLDYFLEDSACYLVMDYVEGPTLATRMGIGRPPSERRPLPLDEALDYANQLCEVLLYLHSQQPAVVFGDLKPSNVLLTPDGRAVMVDFGIARPSASRSETPPWHQGVAGSSPGSSDTQPLGTPGYAAPEQYEYGQRADPRSDIFTLGVLLYEMVTGQAPPPFPFGFQPVRQLNPTLPVALENLIERALHFHAEDRFQSARELSQALRRVAQEVALQGTPGDTQPMPVLAEAPQVIIPTPAARAQLQRGHFRRSLLLPIGAAGLMAVIAFGLLLLGLTTTGQQLAQGNLAAAPTNTSTPRPTTTPTLQPTATPWPTPTRARQIVPTRIPTATPMAQPSATPTETPTTTPSPTPTRTPGQTPTPSPSATPTGTPPSSPSPSPTPTGR